MSIVYLKISTWQGISLGATHYYGELVMSAGEDYRVIELKKSLTKRQAAKLNKAADMDWLYEPGDQYHGFDTKAEIIVLAVKTFRDHFPGADLLILGNPAYSEPMPILVGDSQANEKAEELVTAAEAIGGYGRGKDKEMDKLVDAWRELIRPYEKEG